MDSNKNKNNNNDSNSNSNIDNNIITTAHYKDLGFWMAAALKVFYEKNK